MRPFSLRRIFLDIAIPSAPVKAEILYDLGRQYTSRVYFMIAIIICYMLKYTREHNDRVDML